MDFPWELPEGDVPSRTSEETNSCSEEAKALRNGQHQPWLVSICPEVPDGLTQLPLRMNKELLQPRPLLSLDSRNSLVGVLDSQRTRAETPELNPTFLCP